MSIARGFGRGEISCASAISSSVVSPIAESTATTRWPAVAGGDEPAATSLILSVSPTEVPPNFMTTVLPCGAGRSGATSGTLS